MNRLLAAATALALVGGVAFAEITVSGDAKFGLNYTSVPMDDDGNPDDHFSKHSFTHELGINFAGSGTTDNGLSFGGKVGFDTGDDAVNTGKVFVKGAFGTVTIGDNDAADLLAGGIADIGLDGQGIDDVVEDIRGTSSAQFRYDQSVGNITLAISAGTSNGAPGVANLPVNNFASFDPGSFEVKRNSYAVGMNFSASGATFGIGYDSAKTISAGIGYSTGHVSANALWVKRDQPYSHLGSGGVVGTTGPEYEADGTFDAGYSGLGLDVSYTIGASTLTMVYAKTDVDNIQPIIYRNIVGIIPSVSFKGMGVGFEHDLGGGAKLVAGFGQVPTTVVGELGMAEIGQIVADADGDKDIDIADRPDLSGDRNVASVGLSFSF